ncbi:uncharacterized protein I303_102099 [Kwoniella dejecticola CBS 10117]|uniref:Uncharacterized protein n=1 Tax=Kwoniella dejecticola CBS 10117 TaxID=1296121 RepID=A0A1A6ABY6_9TREE|nr:uncharacterized protein I303_01761 [Kwoniella dejecticola CBS 10117]OBR87553.1 hypothetical protein I303_01761 [Kwoniella dejecticola CBS 10117]
MSSHNRQTSTASAFSSSSDGSASQDQGGRSPAFAYEEFMNNTGTTDNTSTNRRNSNPSVDHGHLGSYSPPRTPNVRYSQHIYDQPLSTGSRPPSYASQDPAQTQNSVNGSPRSATGEQRYQNRRASTASGVSDASDTSDPRTARATSSPTATRFGSIDEVYSLYDDSRRMTHETYTSSRRSNVNRRAPAGRGASTPLSNPNDSRL